MNLNYIDMVIRRYRSSLDEGDLARLAFFRKLWGVMDEASALPQPAYQLPEQEYVHTVLRLEEPLLKSYPVAIDAITLGETMNRLVACALAEGGFGSNVHDSLAGVDWSALLASVDLDAAGSYPVEFLAQFAEFLTSQEMDASSINLAVALVSMALRVQLEPVARRLVDLAGADEMEHVHPHKCPVCGTDPLVARVGGDNSTNGRGKTLGCLQCGTSWEYDRIRCARCGTNHQRHLHYYNLEGDDAHRINTCDECGGYIRTVFVDDAPVPVSFEVEDVVMAKLDAMAADPKFHE